MNNIQAKDLISLGLFTVLYFVLGCCVAIPIGFVPIFLPVLGTLWAIITGIPFMLYVTRVKTFGLITLMAILSGLLGDLILKSGGYRSTAKILVGYAVFSLWMVGTYIPMYFMVEASYESFAASFGDEYATQVMAVMPPWSLALVVVGIFLGALVGGLLGRRLLRKHFARAGIV